MKRLMIVLLTISFVVPSVAAAPKWLTAVPRAVGRTYGNMFTFKHPVLALEQWASVGAIAFDEQTTISSFNRCYNCVETGPLYHGKRYGPGIAVLGTVVAGSWYATSEQYGDELLRDDPNRFWCNLNNALFVIPVTYHLTAGVSNLHTPALSRP